MLFRWSLGLVLSVVAHLGVVVIALALGARGFSGPVEVEIAGVSVEEVKALPLGRPQPGTGKARAAARARGASPAPPQESGTLGLRPRKENKPRRTSPSGDQAAPAPP